MERYRGKGSFELNQFFSRQRNLVSWKNTVSGTFTGQHQILLFLHCFDTNMSHVILQLPHIRASPICTYSGKSPSYYVLCLSHSSELRGRQ